MSSLTRTPVSENASRPAAGRDVPLTAAELHTNRLRLVRYALPPADVAVMPEPDDFEEVEVIPEHGGGWGTPGGIYAEAVVIDRQCAASMACRCGHRGLTLEPAHTEDGEWSPLGRCPRCMRAEPV
jgi:hypothetical protein